MRPPPFLFLFFDTRRRSSLIAYRSLRHLTVTHTDTRIRLNQKKKKRSTLLNSTGGGDTDTRWDLFPNAHRWRCEAFAWEVRTALWICEPPPPPFFLKLHLLPFWIPVEEEMNKAMDYSVCLLLLLSTISSVSVGQFPTAQMWVQLQNSLLASESRSFAVCHEWQPGFFTEF